MFGQQTGQFNAYAHPQQQQQAGPSTPSPVSGGGVYGTSANLYDRQQHDILTQAPPPAGLGQLDLPTTSGNSKPRHSVGGRPRDRVWELFDGDRDVARCHYCTWKTDHPKAFRMRAHALICENLPQEKKELVESWQQEKEDKKGSSGGGGGGGGRGDGEDGGGAPAVKKAKRDHQPKMAARSPITCHVLDSTSGKPAPDMRIRLDRLNTTGFTLITQGQTDNDGRCSSLLSPSTVLEVGIFKMTFFTSEYFTKRGILSFYPFVEIPFEVKSSDEHYHIPLLLSPYAYSTYRGS